MSAVQRVVILLLVASALVSRVAAPLFGAQALPATPQDSRATAASIEPDAHDGSWRVVPAESFVGYRVHERLGFLPAPSDAVGRTSSIVGIAQISGQQITRVAVSS